MGLRICEFQPISALSDKSQILKYPDISAVEPVPGRDEIYNPPCLNEMQIQKPLGENP